MPSFSFKYENFGDFIDEVADESIPTWEGYRASQEDSGDWSGNVNVKKAIKLARFGWREGREMMHTELELAHNATAFDRLPSFAYDVAGYMPNVPLYVAGCPAHMMSPLGNEKAQEKVVEIKVNISASCGNNADTLMRRGASILSLIDKLEDAGLSCQLTIVEYTRASSSGRGYFLMEFPIKKAGQPMDIDRCAYALVHPSMLRKLTFVKTEQTLKSKAGWQGGYGTPADLPYHMRHGCVYFPTVDRMKESEMKYQMDKTISIYENQTSGKDWDGSLLDD